ncbi:MAG: hypothetical protein MG2_1454 [uncultured Candidatus Poseidoniales archaeon]|nr:MAG: hypothetical protein MG2_1454 [uncultured Candidatus Poseidoniales archaeon]
MVSNASVLAILGTFGESTTQYSLHRSRGEFMSVVGLAQAWTCPSDSLPNLLGRKGQHAKKQHAWLLIWPSLLMLKASLKWTMLTFLACR